MAVGMFEDWERKDFDDLARLMRKLVETMCWAGEGRSNIHGGAILVGLLTIGGPIAGLIVGIVTAYRPGQRVTRPAWGGRVSRACV